MPGALRSSIMLREASISPLPSRGSPRALTTLPRNSGPAGTSSTRPVRRTVSPS